MMRFQSVSPDYLPFSNSNGNGKKSNLRTTPTATATPTCQEREREDFDFNSNCDGVKALRFRSPSKTTTTQDNSNSINANSPPLSENQNQSQRLDGSPGHGGDVLLQWGQKKRARLSRTEIRSLTVTHHSSPLPPSSSSIHNHKLQRRGSPFLDDKLPPPHHASSTTTRPSTLRTKETSGFIPNTKRSLEDRSAAVGNASPSRNPPTGNTRAVSRSTAAKTSPSSPEKTDKKFIPCSASRKDEKPNPNGSLTRLPDHDTHLDSAQLQLDQEPATTTTTTTTNTVSLAMTGGAEKVNIAVIEWPKIYVALSRKEKEDDFLAMKGTKLPHRPKKRAKNIDRALQYCFPGMWLSDLTRSRYEVREKKSVKKLKRRGLKGMESMDSYSE